MGRNGIEAALCEPDGTGTAGIDRRVIKQDAHLDGHVIEFQGIPELAPEDGAGLRDGQIADCVAGDGKGMDALECQKLVLVGIAGEVLEEFDADAKVGETAAISLVIAEAAFPLGREILCDIELVHARLPACFGGMIAGAGSLKQGGRGFFARFVFGRKKYPKLEKNA